MLDAIIAKNLAELRKKAGLTQSELAKQLNYSDKAVSKWERGESIPDINILKALADIYGVSVDYLLTEEHIESKTEDATRIIRNNRIIITLLATTLVWLVATAVFVALGLTLNSFKYLWLTFLFAVPVSAIVLLVFNSIWGKRAFNYIIISVLVWSIFLSLYFLFEIEKMWLIFFVGIPAQIIIIFWSRLKKTK